MTRRVDNRKRPGFCSRCGWQLRFILASGGRYSYSCGRFLWSPLDRRNTVECSECGHHNEYVPVSRKEIADEWGEHPELPPVREDEWGEPAEEIEDGWGESPELPPGEVRPMNPYAPDRARFRMLERQYPRLAELRRNIRTLRALVKDDPECECCYGCVWELFVKRALVQSFGGYVNHGEEWRPVSNTVLFELYDLDPARGCGVGPARELTW